MTDDLVLVRVRTWTSADEESVALVSLPGSLHETLMSYVEHGEIPADEALREQIFSDGGATAVREQRVAIAARIALAQGTPLTALTTWEIVTY